MDGFGTKVLLFGMFYSCVTHAYFYQAQLYKTVLENLPQYVLLLGDRHECPVPQWAVALEQSEMLLGAVSALKGAVITESFIEPCMYAEMHNS